MQTNDQETIKYTSWALHNLVSGGSGNLKKKIALTALLKLVLTQDDLEVLSNSLSALLEITDESMVGPLVDSKIVNRFV